MKNAYKVLVGKPEEKRFHMRLGREADHSPPTSAMVKNAPSCTSTPQYVFMAVVLG
jgi:hypothetical protein